MILNNFEQGEFSFLHCILEISILIFHWATQSPYLALPTALGPALLLWREQGPCVPIASRCGNRFQSSGYCLRCHNPGVNSQGSSSLVPIFLVMTEGSQLCSQVLYQEPFFGGPAETPTLQFSNVNKSLFKIAWML